MLRKSFFGSGSNVQQAVNYAIEQFDEYIQTFDNVQFVEKFNISGNAYRWIYLINGFENLYFCIESNTNVSNNYLFVTMRTSTGIHATSNSASNALFRYSIYVGTQIVFDACIISSNNKIKGLTCSSFNDIDLLRCPFNMFVVQDNTNYLIVPPIDAIGSTGYAYLDNSSATRLYVLRYGMINYTVDNVALFQNRIITNTESNNNAPFVLKLDGIFNIMNAQFWNNSAAVLLEINGTRYRKIGADYTFTYDGDTE